MNIENEITEYLELAQFNERFGVVAVMSNGIRIDVVTPTNYNRALDLGKKAARIIDNVQMIDTTDRALL